MILLSREDGRKGELQCPYMGDLFRKADLIVMGHEYSIAVVDIDNPNNVDFYSSIASLMKEWRDYEELDWRYNQLKEQNDGH